MVLTPSERLDGPIAHKCGVFAIYGHPEAVHLARYALLALQHRGQEAAGIAASDGRDLRVARGMGLVTEALGGARLDPLLEMGATSAIGHVRYSTAGASSFANAQPLMLACRQGKVAIAHNGNLTNTAALRQRLAPAALETDADTELILHLIGRSRADGLGEALMEALGQVEGAYALAVQGAYRIWLCRDPNGIRPLVLGTLGSAWVAASESCALDAIGASVQREVAPGEVMELGPGGPRTIGQLTAPAASGVCLFEYVYLARPDSEIGGRNVHLARKDMGRRLWQQAPVPADVVVGVPDTGVSAAVGFAEASGIPYELGLIKNRYVGRTFIQPSQALREAGVRLKLNAVTAVLEGRSVVLVEDSIVRGTTARRLVDLVRGVGAREVHLRIASPPFVHPCYYGIDIPRRADLLAPGLTLAQMAGAVGADSLAFLSLDAAREAAGGGSFCAACFTGCYPVESSDALARAGAGG